MPTSSRRGGCHDTNAGPEPCVDHHHHQQQPQQAPASASVVRNDLRASLQLAVTKICLQEDEEAAATATSSGSGSAAAQTSPGAVLALSELLHLYVTTCLAHDLEAFCRHAGRKTIHESDVLLVARKHPTVRRRLQEFVRRGNHHHRLLVDDEDDDEAATIDAPAREAPPMRSHMPTQAGVAHHKAGAAAGPGKKGGGRTTRRDGSLAKTEDDDDDSSGGSSSSSTGSVDGSRGARRRGNAASAGTRTAAHAEDERNGDGLGGGASDTSSDDDDDIFEVPAPVAVNRGVTNAAATKNASRPTLPSSKRPAAATRATYGKSTKAKAVSAAPPKRFRLHHDRDNGDGIGADSDGDDDDDDDDSTSIPPSALSRVGRGGPTTTAKAKATFGTLLNQLPTQVEQQQQPPPPPPPALPSSVPLTSVQELMETLSQDST